MTDPAEIRESGDEGRSPASTGYLRELLDEAAQLLVDAVQEIPPHDFVARRTRFFQIVEAVRANG